MRGKCHCHHAGRRGHRRRRRTTRGLPLRKTLRPRHQGRQREHGVEHRRAAHRAPTTSATPDRPDGALARVRRHGMPRRPPWHGAPLHAYAPQASRVSLPAPVTTAMAVMAVMRAMPCPLSRRVCAHRHRSGLSIDGQTAARQRMPRLRAIPAARGAAYGVKSIALHGSVPRLVDDELIVAHRPQHANRTAPQNLHRFGSPPSRYAISLRGRTPQKRRRPKSPSFHLSCRGGPAHRVIAESGRRDTRELIPSTLR